MEGVTAIICLFVFLLACRFYEPIAILIVSVANWINKKAGVNGAYTIKDNEINKPKLYNPDNIKLDPQSMMLPHDWHKFK